MNEHDIPADQLGDGLPDGPFRLVRGAGAIPQVAPRGMDPNSISSELAVDRALNAAERLAFLQFCLVGNYEGADPADWISAAEDADSYLEHIEPWLDEHADRHVAYLATQHGLPEQLCRRLLVSALHATFGIASATLGERRRAVVEIASGAALWSCGYAEALGWARPR